MEREFAYYNPASNRISFPHMANADETIYAGNPFGKCQDSYGYKRIPRDKQTIPRDCDVIPRSMSSVSVFQQIPGETVFSTPGAVSPSAEGLSSRSGKRAFDSRAISNPKRSRTVFQPHQLRRLQYEFDREMYMVGMKRRNLSKELDLSEKQIKIWFQNRRMKQKREHNRKRNRSFENLQKVCADPNRYFDEFGGLEALDISDSRNANNPRMLML